MATLRKAFGFTIPRVINSLVPTSYAGSSIQSRALSRPILGSFSLRQYSSETTDIDLSSEESRRITFNRLLYRSKQRGYLELDLILGKWVEDNIHSMDDNRIRDLVHVLDVENPDLWKWLSGQEQPPETLASNPVFTLVHEKVMNNLNKHASPETRATPGQPWVRGWDDFKKGKDGPLTGNQ